MIIQAKFDRIIEAIANGSTVPAAIKAEGVNHSLWYKCLKQSSELKNVYARAREARADLLAEELIDIADSVTPHNHKSIKLRLDARKWYISKILPKQYGKHKAIREAFTVNIRTVITD